MADQRYWDGGTSSDPANVNNWSDSDGGATPASSVPGTGDHAHGTAGGGANAMTLTAHWALGDLTLVAGYTGKLDLAAYNLTMDDGGNVTLDGGGEFDCGSGSHSVTNGTFDYKDQDTFTCGTSTWTLGGTGNWSGKDDTAGTLHSLTIPAEALITLTTGQLEVKGTLTVNGQLSISASQQLTVVHVATGDLRFGSSGSTSGEGTLQLWKPQAGRGISVKPSGASISVATLIIAMPSSDGVIASGEYGAGLFKVYNNAAAAYTLTLSDGEYTFTGDLEVENTDAGGSLTIANDTNNPTITVQGDVIWDEQAGTINYNVSSNAMTASGLVDQSLDFGDEASENLIIDKPTSGNVTLENIDLVIDEIDMAGDFTVSSGDFDTATSATCTIGGDVTLDGNAVDLGDSTTWTISGSFDYKDVTTFDDGTSTVVLDGTGNVVGHSSNYLYNLTFAEGSTYTIHADTVSRVVAVSNCQILGTVVLSDTLAVTGNGDVTIGENANVSGSSYIYSTQSNAGHGITSVHSGATLTCNIWVYAGDAGKRLAPLSTSGKLLVLSTATSTTLALDADGEYSFGSLELEARDTGSVTLANTTNGPASITVTGDLIIDLDSSGNITIDDSNQPVLWNIGGDIKDEWTGEGTFTWTKGNSLSTVTANGSGAQSWDCMDQTLAAVVVNKSGGTLTFLGGFTADSFNVYSGTVDFNGDTFVTVGNFSITSSGAIVSGADAMNDADITVGGDLRLDGAPGKRLNLSGTSEWTLNVTGTAVIRHATIAYCNASGGSTVQARGCTDGGNNSSNVVFLPADTGNKQMRNRWRRRPMIQRAS